MKITDIRFERVEGLFSGHWAIEERQVGALDIYSEYRQRGVPADRQFPRSGKPDAPAPIHGLYMHIDTDEGVTGTFGAIELDQALQIATRLRPHLIGQDPLATERLWDIMSRHDRHGRKGYMMMAISAVDIALWDIRGQVAGLPVYRLLGGPTRDAIPAYASCLGMSLQPEAMVQRSRALVEEGYKAQKWFFRYGPGDGREGMIKNIEMVRLLREAVGEKVDLMFDAWLGWDVPYAVEMGQRMAPYHPRWLEEPLAPDRIAGYAEVRRRTGIPIAGGEHEYTRWGFKVLLDAEAVDVVQADTDWAGGISELQKIVALCSAYERPVIPHGHSVSPGLHLVASQSPASCPMVEFLLVYLERKQWFHREPVIPEGGMVRLPTTPGIGVELDDAKVLKRETLRF